ncbi:NAD(P)/FAD-dependent oxidoreductase [Brevibacillus massiliensis]|uniref:NAD(P)/FAD-dependent oxidoreductase n=1 Tax=Brevibacillus massiliensis TaxID=1118054 RepID=UPI000307C7F9|nr:FAD-dependent oxidoreductase [Brevibacillus massiliensis]
MRSEYETIIVGGGVIGNSIACHLAEKRQEGILLIEQKYPLTGTSGSTQAWVWVHTKTPAYYGEFSMYSSELYPYLERRIGDVEFHRTGGLAPFFSEAERERAKRLAESQAEVGIEIQVLTRDEVLAMEPALSPEVAGATFSRIDGNVNPLRLVEMYMRTAKKHGVEYLYYNRVTNLEKRQGSFVVQSKKGRFTAKNLILCAGVWSREVGKMLGVNIPIDPVRGQILITEPLAPLLNHTISSMRQTLNGEVLIGYSHERAGFDRSSTLDIMQNTASMAARYVPALARAHVVRCFSGIRAMPEDELPILGKVPGVEHLYVAAMHSGITLSPLVGTLMTELITEGDTSIPIDRYSIARFA